jgi:hypothetical protein
MGVLHILIFSTLFAVVECQGAFSFRMYYSVNEQHLNISVSLKDRHISVGHLHSPHRRPIIGVAVTHDANEYKTLCHEGICGCADGSDRFSLKNRGWCRPLGTCHVSNHRATCQCNKGLPCS